MSSIKSVPVTNSLFNRNSSGRRNSISSKQCLTVEIPPRRVSAFSTSSSDTSPSSLTSSEDTESRFSALVRILSSPPNILDSIMTGMDLEDYSANGDAWSYFPHDHARSRAYRWGEDGLAGFSDDKGILCWSLGLWNGKDGILKERLFGVTGHEGNHGEDVKELYYYLDSTPTHSYMKFLYKYPQRKFPYEELVAKNTSRTRDDEEFELMDTGILDEDRYWDVFVEYAKDADDPEDIFIRIIAYNRGPESADLHILPQLTFSNSWSWSNPESSRPSLSALSSNTILGDHPTLGRRYFHCISSPPPADVGADEEITPDLIFTENDTNFVRLYDGENASSYVKDGFHDHIIPSHRMEDDTSSYVNPDKKGTKSGAHYVFKDVPPNGGCAVVRLKLTRKSIEEDTTAKDEELFDGVIEARKAEADDFYDVIAGSVASHDLRNITRQALAGMLWSKQFYQFKYSEWIKGDPSQPPPPPERKFVRNQAWRHIHVADVLSMPDKWEYPFFAVWDTAFHCISLAVVDPEFAKNQLLLFTRDWYMKADGEIPAYEWNFSDVNPPVHAWSAFRVFKIERQLRGVGDTEFLKTIFLKLMINFTWWVNRKDTDGKNVFEGGFLGLDNIGAFNRSEPLPNGGTLRQADGTAWMAFYCLNMLNIALELAKEDKTYEDIASKFFEHFISISDAMAYDGEDHDSSLWNDDEEFYFDAIQWHEGTPQQIPVRSLVGLIPLYATLTLEPSVMERFPNFKERLERFVNIRPEVSQRNMHGTNSVGSGERILLALAGRERLQKILQRMLDTTEFLSDHGIRSLSKYHEKNPFSMQVNGEKFEVHYWPGDSKSGMFGGNSNWRGPIWLATNFLLIESLQRFHQYYGDTFQIECPTGSGNLMDLSSVAKEIRRRIISIFAHEGGCRPTNGGHEKLDKDHHFRDLVLFHEFFHGDTGRGLGASHQTGWTGLVAYHIMQSADTRPTPRTPKSFASHYFHDNINTPSEEKEFSGESILLKPTRHIAHALQDVSPNAL
ncbi:Six-hairpin glycosidase-like protein [Cantharellus anzutake]|uniref:Six-hairpin glycosidase-like protein n=1 Tax=Cantharellus anzutake TaxID=1750568 RepID=UPI001908872A|nr:Six-hairpin glycosidase-like protein [Cantharellus anzutake]KAF8335748.1 Six-hairpin glycosidase-like protein [Cantharellus anzutake]